MPPARSTRTRQPSTRALEIQAAAAAAAESTPAPSASAPGPRRRGGQAAAGKAGDKVARSNRNKTQKVSATTKAGSSRTRGKGKQIGEVPAVTEEEDEEDVKTAPVRRSKKVKPAVEEDEDEEEEDTLDQDLTLYCLCLGFDTGEQPMIQCDVCSNWFHFNCINMTEAEAANIEAYCCDPCEGMDPENNKTRYVGQHSSPTAAAADEASAASDNDGNNDDDGDGNHSDASLPSAASASASDSDSDSGGDDDEDVSSPAGVDMNVDSVETDHGAGQDDSAGTRGRTTRNKGKRSIGSGGEEKKAVKRRRSSVATAISKEEDDGGEYVAEGEEEGKGKGRATARGGRGKKSQTTSAKETIPATLEREGSTTDNAAAAASTDEPTTSAASTSIATPSAKAAPPTTANKSEKTRSHVVSQLTFVFSSIFAGDGVGDSTSAGVLSRSTAFAEAVESTMFSQFSEPDLKADGRPLGPRAKYLAKFRSLHYNLKTNAAFRGRIAGNEIGPEGIVGMSSEDLMTPELRAIAEEVRARSLKDSMREVRVAPKVKMTHKGAQEIEGFETEIEREVEAEVARRENVDKEKRERSLSLAQGSPPAAAVEENPSQSAQFSPPSAGSPVVRSRQNSAIAVGTAVESPGVSHSPAADPVERGSNSPAVHSPIVIDAGAHEHMPPPPPRQRSSFDISSLWGQVKASPKAEGSEHLESTPRDLASPAEEPAPMEEDDYDPTRSLAGAGGDNNDFESSLFNNDDFDLDQDPIASTTPPAPPPTAVVEASETPTTPLVELDPVWYGDLIVPEEGGFPAFGVQLGGRPFGAAPMIWRQLLPSGLKMDGRIPTPVATKYLVECSFAATRELVVVGILPDQRGPDERFPRKPTGEASAAKHAHIIDFYANKDRIGVVAPQGELKRLVKDIYIIPLKKTEPLPEYVELLDDHVIPDTGKRDKDLLLCVLVVTKGSLPSLHKVPVAATAPPPPPMPESTSSTNYSADMPTVSGPQPGVMSTVFNPVTTTVSQIASSISTTPAPAAAPAAPLYDQKELHTLLQSTDTANLSALLSNPIILKSLVDGSDQIAIHRVLANPNLVEALANSPAALEGIQRAVQPLAMAPTTEAYNPLAPAPYGRTFSSAPPYAGDKGGGISPPRRGTSVHPSRMNMVPDATSTHSSSSRFQDRRSDMPGGSGWSEARQTEWRDDSRSGGDAYQGEGGYDRGSRGGYGSRGRGSAGRGRGGRGSRRIEW